MRYFIGTHLCQKSRKNTLMDYDNFKEQFVEDVKERLYEQGTEVDITVNTVNKLNESYEAVAVKPDGSSIGIWRNQCRSDILLLKKNVINVKNLHS